MRITNNQKAFLELVRAGLWEQNVQLSQYGKIDFTEVCRLAEEQSVVGLVAAGIEHVVDVKVPKMIALQLAGVTIQIEQRNKEMNSFLSELIEKLRRADIYTLLLKGQGVAQCYEKPLWRACGDIDFFLSEPNYGKAKAYLCPLATSVEKEKIFAKHVGMTIDSTIVELHGNLKSGLSRKIDNELEGVYEDAFYNSKIRSWVNHGVDVFLLDALNDSLYIFTHLLTHYYKGGVGLRQICDWCRLLYTYHKDINISILETKLRRMGLQTVWKAFAAFAVEYLGMSESKMPLYSKDVKLSTKAQKICLFILDVGNMGHNRGTNYFNQKSYALKKMISLKIRCEDIFGHMVVFPIETMQFIPYMLFNGVRSALRGE